VFAPPVLAREGRYAQEHRSNSDDACRRMSGFGGVSKRPYGKEFIEYPQFTKRMMERLGKINKVLDAPEAIADIKYRDTALIDAEIERLTRQSAAVKPRVTEFFVNAPSPGIVATTMLNAHYASHEAYLDAIAHEIRTEYLAVTNAGFVLQIDAPDLAMERVLLFQTCPTWQRRVGATPSPPCRSTAHPSPRRRTRPVSRGACRREHNFGATPGAEARMRCLAREPAAKKRAGLKGGGITSLLLAGTGGASFAVLSLGRGCRRAVERHDRPNSRRSAWP
jgi:hypothetical protein